MVDAVERSDREHQIVGCKGRRPLVFNDRYADRSFREQWTGIHDVDCIRMTAKPARPPGVRAADQQTALKATVGHRDPLETVGEHALVKEQLDPRSGGAVAAKRPGAGVEQ